MRSSAKQRDDTTRCVCFNLRKATRAITHVYDAALRPAGLRATQFTVLNVVRAMAPAGVTQIAAQAVSDRTTLTRSLALLERADLVRVVASDDARERRYALTAGGGRALARAAPLWDAAQARVVDLLGAPLFGRLLHDLDDVVRTARAAKAERTPIVRRRKRA